VRPIRCRQFGAPVFMFPRNQHIGAPRSGTATRLSSRRLQELRRMLAGVLADPPPDPLMRCQRVRERQLMGALRLAEQPSVTGWKSPRAVIRPIVDPIWPVSIS